MAEIRVDVDVDFANFDYVSTTDIEKLIINERDAFTEEHVEKLCSIFNMKLVDKDEPDWKEKFCNAAILLNGINDLCEIEESMTLSTMLNRFSAILGIVESNWKPVVVSEL